jgi:NADH-quinone oxidoreductase subunit A
LTELVIMSGSCSPAALVPVAAQTATETAGFLPIFLLGVIAAGFAFVNLIATSIFGPSRMGRVKAMPYESGVEPAGDTRQPFTVQYYLVALLFLVFDVELVFLFPWATIFRESAAGQGGVGAGLLLSSMFLFVAVLGLAFVYAWLQGVFDWAKAERS